MFFQGSLDSALVDKCKALDASFEYDDLRFLRDEILQAQLESPGVPAQQLAEATRQKLIADFSLFQAELKSEQVAWHNFRVKVAEAENTELSAKVLVEEQRQEALAKAVAEHQERSYRTVCLPQFKGVPAFLESSLGSFASQPPVRSPDQIWRVNVINACCLGVQASLVLPQVAPLLSADHAHHPERTMTIIILPNTPEWGHVPQHAKPHSQLQVGSLAKRTSALQPHLAHAEQPWTQAWPWECRGAGGACPETPAALARQADRGLSEARSPGCHSHVGCCATPQLGARAAAATFASAQQ